MHLYGSGMESGELLRFRITAWPGVVVPVPGVVVPGCWEVEPGVLVFGAANKEYQFLGMDPRPVPTTNPDGSEMVEDVRWTGVHRVVLPDEAYLRHFASRDLAGHDAALSFSAMFGPVGQPGHADLPAAAREWAVNALDTSMPSAWVAAKDVLDRRVPLSDVPVSVRHAVRMPCEPWTIESLSAVSLYRGVLHDLVNLWRFISGSLELSELEAEWCTPSWRLPRTIYGPVMKETKLPPNVLGGHTIRRLVEQTDPYGEAMRMLEEGLNAGLAPFHVRLEIVDVVEDDDLFAYGRPSPSVYQAMCLQLANHIAENAEYRRCAAQGCEQLFVRQHGRAKYGQHRTRGVLRYCSDDCANRQAQRNHRRRKAEQRGGGANDNADS